MNLKVRRTQAMNNFWQRTLTGIAFVAVILTSIYFQDKYFIFTGIFGLVNILALYEFYKITNISDRVNVPTIYLIICGTILYFGCFWLAKYGRNCYSMLCNVYCSPTDCRIIQKKQLQLTILLFRLWDKQL